MKRRSSTFAASCPRLSGRPTPRRAGFTLIEIILVLVVIVIVSGISIPYFAKSHRGTKLRTAARAVERMSRYARSMAIMREETLTLMLDTTTMELSVGSKRADSQETSDGEISLDVAKRLNYIDGDGASGHGPNLDKLVHRLLPEGLTVRDFTKDAEDEVYDDIDYVRFYPNGQCDWFTMELEDNRGLAVKIENDPISGRIWTEFVQ